MGVSSGDFKDASCSHYTAPSDQTDIMSFFETREPESKRRKTDWNILVDWNILLDSKSWRFCEIWVENDSLDF